jgi:hypothetical protein
MRSYYCFYNLKTNQSVIIVLESEPAYDIITYLINIVIART